ncbi:MAG: hypothetical protein AAF682_01810 [Planctomycetota bacterium]
MALATLAAAEAGLRLLLRARGEPYRAVDTRTVLASLRDEVRGDLPDAAGEGSRRPPGFELHPFFGYERRDSDEVERWAVELATGEPRDELSIVLVGGSVAAMFALDGADQVVERLEASGRAPRPPRVIGLARAGYKQPQQLALVSYLLSRGARPDVVVNLDGYNEVASSLRNLRLGLPPHFPTGNKWIGLTAGTELDRGLVDLLADVRAAQLAVEARVDRVLGVGADRSALLGTLGLAWARRAHRRWASSQDDFVRSRTEAPADGAGGDVDPLEGLDEVVAFWAESSRSLAAMCGERGIRYVHLLQPTLQDAGSKPTTAPERRFAAPDSPEARRVSDGYERMRARGAALARDGVEFHDLSQTFADVRRTVYVDFCHLGPEGNKLLAERVADALLAGMH